MDAGDAREGRCRTVRDPALMVRTIDADRGDAGRRLDLVLSRHLAGVEGSTRTRVQAWIAGGLVVVNGRVVRRTASRVALADAIAVTLPAAAPRPGLSVAELPIEVLYEDAHLLAIDKPAGLVAHPTHAHTDGTLLNALAGYARSWPAGQRPSLLGRLDRFTSGVVLVAKTAAVHAALQRGLASRQAGKEYLAVVYGRPPMAGRIEANLRRDTADRRRVVVSATDGRPSVTEFERLSLARVGPGVVIALVRCRLVTGRTHQIRVHLASKGWPIVGDPVYGEPRWRKITDEAVREALRAFPRQALHAWRLTFVHPITHTGLRIEARIPEDIDGLAALTTADRQASPRGR